MDLICAQVLCQRHHLLAACLHCENVLKPSVPQTSSSGRLCFYSLCLCSHILGFSMSRCFLRFLHGEPVNPEKEERCIRQGSSRCWNSTHLATQIPSNLFHCPEENGIRIEQVIINNVKVNEDWTGASKQQHSSNVLQIDQKICQVTRDMRVNTVRSLTVVRLKQT